MKQVNMRLDDELGGALEAAAVLTGLTKTAFVTMATTIMLQKMQAISLPPDWTPPEPVVRPEADPLLKGAMDTDDDVIIGLIRTANAIVILDIDGNVNTIAWDEKAAIYKQVADLRRAQANTKTPPQ